MITSVKHIRPIPEIELLGKENDVLKSKINIIERDNQEINAKISNTEKAIDEIKKKTI